MAAENAPWGDVVTSSTLFSLPGAEVEKKIPARLHAVEQAEELFPGWNRAPLLIAGNRRRGGLAYELRHIGKRAPRELAPTP